MPAKVQALAVLASLGLLTTIVYLIRKGRLREEHALLWLLTGFCILVLSAWRGSLTSIARLLDIGYAPSLLFAVGMVFTLLILLAHTAVLSRLVGHTRDLAQHLSILEWQVQQLEQQLRQGAGAEPFDAPQDGSSDSTHARNDPNRIEDGSRRDGMPRSEEVE